jgi:hypothetical protein
MFEFMNDDSYGNEDSFFVGPEFDLPPSSGEVWYFLRPGNHDDPYENPPYWEGYYHWSPVTVGSCNGCGIAPEYEIQASDVGAVFDFNLGDRDRGSSVDAWVFSLNPNLTDDELDRLLGTPGTDVLRAGDANQDLEFDQLDLVQVQIAAKYLSGQAATWGEGDWNGAPGGQPGSPPVGNGFFDQLDIIAALAAGTYLNGSYAAIGCDGIAGDGQTSVVYHANTGELSVDAPDGVELTSINIDSAAGIFTGMPRRISVAALTMIRTTICLRPLSETVSDRSTSET